VEECLTKLLKYVAGKRLIQEELMKLIKPVYQEFPDENQEYKLVITINASDYASIRRTWLPFRMTTRKSFRRGDGALGTFQNLTHSTSKQMHAAFCKLMLSEVPTGMTIKKI
jgi:hypothetical protein